jgi:hypothetical protein
MFVAFLIAPFQSSFVASVCPGLTGIQRALINFELSSHGANLH